MNQHDQITDLRQKLKTLEDRFNALVTHLEVSKPADKVNFPNGRLRPGVREAMRQRRDENMSYRQIAAEYGTNMYAVKRIISGERHQ